MKKLLILAAISTLSAMGFSAPASAQGAEIERYTQVRTLPEHGNIDAGQSIKIATIINLKPHWHVYWANPGDSGLPVKIDWTLPEGFTISDIQWPVPDKISYDILSNYGYYDRVVLLQDLKAPDNFSKQNSAPLSAKIEMLVCNDICIPETQEISFTLNSPDTQAAESGLIAESVSKLPVSLEGSFSFAADHDVLKISISPNDYSAFEGISAEKLEFFPLDWGIINHNENPSVTLENGTITIEHKRGDQPMDSISTLNGVLVIKGEIGKNTGYEISAGRDGNSIPSANSAPIEKSGVPEQHTTEPQKSSMTIGLAIFFAFMGGLILNLMPCVFPVLSMKALSLVKMAERNVRLARMHGIAYTGGVVLSFVLIGALLLLLKEGGQAIGWGFQLQSPFVVALLGYLLFAIGLNLLGLFDVGTGLTNFGNRFVQGHGLAASFSTGVLATVVATPCTAPFMGAAMGFALLQPALVSISVFIALGLGLAFPYLFLAYVPATRRVLPRPGAWMKTFKEFLAFPMFASAIWLAWVVAQQAGTHGVLVVMLGMLSLAFCVWLLRLSPKGKRKYLTYAAIAFFVVLPLLSAATLVTVEGTAMEQADQSFGENFTPEKLSAALDGDQPIFVEMTAAWCITCKINHAVTLNIDATKKLFAEKNIRYFIGDWTNNSEEITNYLSTFGRSGVPLYVYYGARDVQTGKRPEPKILPQVLTSSIVQENII